MPSARHRRSLPLCTKSLPEVLAMLMASSVAWCAPTLRLEPPQSHAGTTPIWRVRVTAADAAPIPPDRATRIAVLASSEPGTDLSLWDKLVGQRLLPNGVLEWDHRPAQGIDRQFFVAQEIPPPTVIQVRDGASLRSAAATAGPGTHLLLAPGNYPGGFAFSNLRGAPLRPIVIAAADPSRPPVFQGGANGIHLTDPEYVELHDLTFAGATANGLNIDDGGSWSTPAHHVVLRGLRVTDVGPDGNRDGLKLSGVRDFRVEGCTIERWGAGGSAIDMVGCHSGLIVSNVLRHTVAVAAASASGVQAKGGSARIVIRRNRFEYAGSRAINAGGSTGLEFFRPPLVAGAEQAEARELVVEGNTFIGSLSPVAFVGVDGADVRFNTFYRPQRWVVRILQENTAAGFVPCRNGRFTDNIVAFDSTQWSAGGVNVGGNTAPSTFQFARNWWYCVDAPSRSRPTLPVTETGGTYGISPRFKDIAAGDLTLDPASPATAVGATALVIPGE